MDDAKARAARVLEVSANFLTRFSVVFRSSKYCRLEYLPVFAWLIIAVSSVKVISHTKYHWKYEEEADDPSTCTGKNQHCSVSKIKPCKFLNKRYTFIIVNAGKLCCGISLLPTFLGTEIGRTSKWQ